LLSWALIECVELTLNCLHVFEVLFEATTSYDKTSRRLGNVSDGLNLLGDLAALKVDVSDSLFGLGKRSLDHSLLIYFN